MSGQPRRDGRYGAGFPWGGSLTRPRNCRATRGVFRRGSSSAPKAHHCWGIPPTAAIDVLPTFLRDRRSIRPQIPLCCFLRSQKRDPCCTSEPLAADPISDEHVACQLCPTATNSIGRASGPRPVPENGTALPDSAIYSRFAPYRRWFYPLNVKGQSCHWPATDRGLETMGTIARLLRFLLVVVAMLWTQAANATFHLFIIREIYSNASGNVQYIVLQTTFGFQQFLTGHQITATSQGGDSHIYTFPSDLPEDSANRSFLIGTEGFASLGIVAP